MTPVSATAAISFLNQERPSSVPGLIIPARVHYAPTRGRKRNKVAALATKLNRNFRSLSGMNGETENEGLIVSGGNGRNSLNEVFEHSSPREADSDETSETHPRLPRSARARSGRDVAMGKSISSSRTSPFTFYDYLKISLRALTRSFTALYSFLTRKIWFLFPYSLLFPSLLVRSHYHIRQVDIWNTRIIIGDFGDDATITNNESWTCFFYY